MSKAKKPHPADSADFAKIAAATKFIACLFLGRGQYAKHEADTLEARTIAAKLPAAHKSTKKAVIYALVDGVSVLVQENYPPTNGAQPADDIPPDLDR